MTSTSLTYDWGSLWRAHVSLPAEIASREVTIFVRAVTRDEAHAAMRHAIQVLYPLCLEEELDHAYYNLSSAADLVDQGTSSRLNDRLFETGWRGNKVCGWVERPVFLVPEAAELFQAWCWAVEA